MVKSKPRAEREAAEQLTRQDYRVVLPELIQPRKRWEALFPSYLFVQPADETHSIAPTDGPVGRFVQRRFDVPEPFKLPDGCRAYLSAIALLYDNVVYTFLRHYHFHL